MIKKLFLLLFAIFVLGIADARAFEYTYMGQTLSYTVLNPTAKTVETTEGSIDRYGTLHPGNRVTDGLTIPSTVTYNGIEYTVTAIGKYSFYQNSKMPSVIIPKTVTALKEGAFSGCSELGCIVLPDNLMTIGIQAFSFCKQITSFTIPDLVTSVSDETFWGCRNLKEVILGKSVTSIGDGTFRDCCELSSITIPKSVTFIGAQALDGCEKLSKIIYNAENATLDKDDYLHHNVFDCRLPSLQTIVIGEDVKFIPEEAFSKGNYENFKEVIFKATKCADCNAPVFPHNLKKVTIEDNIKRIPNHIFEGCNAFSSISIPESVNYIGDYAFSGCGNLSSLTLPNCVNYIGDYAFEYCQGLRKINLENSINDIGKYVFSNCSGLYSISLPDYFTSIREGMFHGCSSLKDVSFGNSIKSIGPNAFSRCGLSDIELPNSVVIIEENAFSNCSELQSVTLGNSVTTIGDEAFSGCMALSTINMPKSIASVGKDAFSKCDWYLKTVNIDSPNSWSKVTFGNVQSNPISQAHTFYVSDWEIKNLVLNTRSVPVSDYAFHDADNLSTVRIKGCGVGSNSFADCSNINALCLDVEFLSKLSFGNCSKLKSIYCLTEEPPAAPNDAFSSDTYKDVTLYVPIGCASKYENTRSCWFHFSNIVESDFSEIDKIFKADYYEDNAGLENIYSNDNKEEIDLNSPYQVYNLEGIFISNSIEILKPGIYIIRQGNLAKKWLVSSEQR